MGLKESKAVVDSLLDGGQPIISLPEEYLLQFIEHAARLGVCQPVVGRVKATAL